ncbi:PT domain-containing protein [Streptomyces sp. NBC_01242]|uniref:PT domain-containing protein n=1 Tax=Streptomyces sp. NBC_01242 TaxID=2903795 RepID=UPI00338FDAFE
MSFAADQPTSRPADQPTSRPADQPTSRPADQPTSRPADQPTSRTGRRGDSCIFRSCSTTPTESGAPSVRRSISPGPWPSTMTSRSCPSSGTGTSLRWDPLRACA